MVFKMKIFVLIILYISNIFNINGFNLSPKPNIILREPNLRIYLPKVQSSYFGFSLNLRERSVMVGAPRAQSTLESQRKVNETGAIYKCSFDTRECNPFILDSLGNTYVEHSDYTYDSEKKDNQWLGASMDGGPKETDRFVVCAPRLLANLPSDYLIHGICYWTPNTTDSRPIVVKKIAPLRLKSNQIKLLNNKKYYYHMFGEQGISVHITENNEEIIMGAPGIHTWKGSIIRYRSKIQEDMGGLSRRDNDQQKISKREIIEYISEIPNPDLWGQPNDSYFGYSVTSGYFEGGDSTKILYVATAPQANQQSGEAYLFEFINTRFGEKSIRIHHTFRGTQFGEFFGYAVLSEDINNDGLVDVIISAPQYSTGVSYENGAVYIFINKGQLNFELHKMLTTQTHFPGRFGTTLTNLGDINHDGYNDIAIGAPFENNGAVYIYLGGSKGLHDKPSQILYTPDNVTANQMYGHGLSKGTDIDGNEFNDLAIGAPNSETVYIYKSYPVIKISASIHSLSREIKIDQTKFQIRACWRLEKTSTKPNQQQEIHIKLKADPKIKRAQFSGGTNQLSFNNVATEQDQCKLYDINVKFSLPDIFKPIEIEMYYELINKIPNSEEFCANCAAIDPTDPVFTTEKIAFSTGCQNEICVADLKLKSSGLKPSYILGSTRTMTVVYNIQNSGETAYLTQINITTSNQIPFAKIPSSCNLNEFVLICDLFKGRPMSNGDKDSLPIVFDTSNLAGSSMEIRAEVFSTGNELNSQDNIILDRIALTEFSEIDITSRAITPILNLEDGLKIVELSNLIEIRNNGPSIIRNLDIILSIPISYLIPNSESVIPLVDFSNITVTGKYNNKLLNVLFTQNNTILIQNPEEYPSSTPAILDNQQGMDFDSSKFGYPIESDQNTNFDNFEDSNNNHIMARKKRHIENNIRDTEYSRIAQIKKTGPLMDELSGTLPVNRTVFFNCYDPNETQCIKATLKVYNFLPGDNLITITTKFNIDLIQVDKILIESKDFFVLTTSVDMLKIDDPKGETLNIHKTLPHNIVSKHQFYTTPIWVYIVSILGGILLLVAITYAMYKFGFFRRHKKEELQKLYRESQRHADDTEDE